MEKIELPKADYEFLCQCVDALRDLWNEKMLENSPKAKERVKKVLEATEGQLI